MVDLGMGPDDSGAKDVAVLQSAPKSFEKLQFSLTGLDELGVSGQHELMKIWITNCFERHPLVLFSKYKEMQN